MECEARRKVREWRRVAKDAAAVKLHDAVDLTLHPAVERATMPGLTPFRRLRTSDILTELVQLPSVAMTSHVSFIFGAVWVLSQLARGAQTPTKGVAPLRLLIGVLLVLLHIRFIRWRQPVVSTVSNALDVSGSARGPCRVVDKVLTITNSHAGTHADMPHHFSCDSNAVAFEDEHYSGDALILDISGLLKDASNDVDDDKPRPITRHIMEDAIAQCGLLLQPVWRLLLVTRHVCNYGDAAWKNGFAYLEPETVRYLAESFPLLLLVGTDAPSVDHPDAAPICEAAHGALYDRGIALLESLQFDAVHSLFKDSRVLRGSIMTVFSTTQSFKDSRGCHVIFFPMLNSKCEAAVE
ncbi:hypothetical protein DQ04_00091010 [Trypanosoma grayi]|uniref:hypothetical protein n=1 Tax=Trypanosoma grayi TaxID=71804 RepID=UPI0004F40140|nr:hypothetical protein DQ04_00091010 [Trypanosoma grayi]KEG15367.1 hypothetical protein DQ04_00091010 [Trypanosoma grayi]